MVATGETVGLAEWIIDGICLVISFLGKICFASCILKLVPFLQENEMSLFFQSTYMYFYFYFLKRNESVHF